jgi:hypothetical protein
MSNGIEVYEQWKEWIWNAMDCGGLVMGSQTLKSGNGSRRNGWFQLISTGTISQ